MVAWGVLFHKDRLYNYIYFNEAKTPSSLYESEGLVHSLDELHSYAKDIL